MGKQSELPMHRGNGKLFVVRADEKLSALIELESAIHACGELA
jgi:hypothetical protein